MSTLFASCHHLTCVGKDGHFCYVLGSVFHQELYIVACCK